VEQAGSAGGVAGRLLGQALSVGLEGPGLVLGALAALPALAKAADGLGRLADSASVLPTLVTDIERLVDMVPAVEALGGAAPALAELSESAKVLGELAMRLEGLAELPAALQTLTPLADAIQQLLRSVEVLNATVGPLQNTAERVGRLVDRLPTRARGIASG